MDSLISGEPFHPALPRGQKKLGAAVLTKQMYKFPGEKDFPSISHSNQGRKPLMSFLLLDITMKAASIVRQVQRTRNQEPDPGGGRFLIPLSSWKSPGQPAEGVIIATNLDRMTPRPLVQNFLKNYQKAYNEDAGHGWRPVMMPL